MLYHDDRKCIVEAQFDIKAYALKDFFDTHDLDYEAILIIRREISPTGKSRAFVNDTPVTIQLLQELTKYLVDMHQQFDMLDIHSTRWQLEVIDSLAGNYDLLTRYQSEYKAYTLANKQLGKLRNAAAAALKELDFITFQHDELAAADLEEDEQTTKEQLLQRLSSSEDITRITSGVYYMLDESEQSIINQLQTLSYEVEQVKELDPQLVDIYDRLLSSIEELRDVADSASDVKDSVEYDPKLASEIQDRLDTIYRLQKKHQVDTIEELLKIQLDLQSKLSNQQEMDGEIAALEKAIDKHKQSLRKLANQLSSSRKKIAPVFEKDVVEALGTLSMEHARLQVLISDADKLTPTGSDTLEYLFSANKGGTLGSIKQVASGGEISRLTLVIKSLVASSMALPTLIFDEIDTGVSGEVANRMAEIIHQLSQQHQVLSITHSPQIAAKANHHYYVYKHETQTRTITNIKLLSSDDRIVEIAKMLSGDPPSDAAVANAKELMK